MHNEKIKLLIILSDAVLSDGIEEYLNLFDVFELVGITRDASVGAVLLGRRTTDVCLLDAYCAEKLKDLIVVPDSNAPHFVILTAKGPKTLGPTGIGRGDTAAVRVAKEIER